MSLCGMRNGETALLVDGHCERLELGQCAKLCKGVVGFGARVSSPTQQYHLVHQFEVAWQHEDQCESVLAVVHFGGFALDRVVNLQQSGH